MKLCHEREQLAPRIESALSLSPSFARSPPTRLVSANDLTCSRAPFATPGNEPFISVQAARIFLRTDRPTASREFTRLRRVRPYFSLPQGRGLRLTARSLESRRDKKPEYNVRRVNKRPDGVVWRNRFARNRSRALVIT